jgi:hypothetical protein
MSMLSQVGLLCYYVCVLLYYYYICVLIEVLLGAGADVNALSGSTTI